MSTLNHRRYAIGVGVVVYVVIASLATLFLSAALFCVVNKRMPSHLKPDSIKTYWNAYKEDPLQKKRLIGSIGISGALFFFFGPFGIICALSGNKRPLHGEARFANYREINGSGLLSGKGILVGKSGKRFLALDGQQFVLLAAPTRSGKGVGVVIPNLLNWPDSVVVLDIKGENYQISSGFRAKYGQKVFAFQPFDESGTTHRYNPLSYVRTKAHLRVGDLQTIAAAFYPASASESGEGGSAQFWNSKARDLFVALALLVMETESLPFTLGELLRQSSGKGKSLKEYLQATVAARDSTNKPLSDECVHALDRFLSNPDNTLGNILSTFTGPLTIFADPIVDAATSSSDFALEDVRKQRLSIYLVIPPPKLPVAGVLINLFFSQLVALNTRQLPTEDASLKYQCLTVLDEFVAMGYVAIMSKGVAYLAAYNLRFLTIVQSKSQLAGVYGYEEANTFTQNHALQILFAPKEQKDAKEYSEWLGTFTAKAESVGRSRHIVGSSSVTASSNVSDHGRELMMPQELRELGRDREIIMLEHCKPILCDKIVYYRDPVFSDRLLNPAPIPKHDALLYAARIQQRKRPAMPSDFEGAINLDAIATSNVELPTVQPTASPDQVVAYVDNFFSCFELEALETHEEAHGEERHKDEAPYTANYSHSDIDLAELEF